MGQLVFQSTAGGQTALVSPNPTDNFALNVPAVNGNLVTTGDTGTVTSTMLASNVYTTPGTIGSGTANTGAFTTLSASSTVSGIGFNNYLASPPAIGGTTANTGKFTTLTTNSNVINGATSGTLTIAATAVAGTNTATFPAATGTVMVSGNMPAFSAYGNTNQTISSGVNTKVIINTKTFDTATAFDATTNYRFIPQVAGYYQMNGIVEAYAGGSAITGFNTFIYKNGAEALRGIGVAGTGATDIYSNVNGLFYMNGTTDYLELYINVTSVGTIILSSSNTYKTFSGCLVRTA